MHAIGTRHNELDESRVMRLRDLVSDDTTGDQQRRTMRKAPPPEFVHGLAAYLGGHAHDVPPGADRDLDGLS
ncbi:hypothetical protein ACIQU6_40055 [Streptomyces sp. NPDC090442]|uniref:hypothetical protein n=1 Tax=Streptomyces sp. NPDC090442 TaxID=3365962 RepID=UPI00382227CB